MNNPPPASELSEATIIAWLAAKLAEHAPRFTGVRDVSITASDKNIGFTGWIGDGYKCAIGSGATVEEAAVAFINEIGTPATQAANLRQQAADLLAKANTLCPAPTTQTP